mgnify:CR=1 FL=1
MGKKITIYDSGQTYEIDSELIYMPEFIIDLFSNKNNGRLSPGLKYQNKDENENTKRDTDQN